MTKADDARELAGYVAPIVRGTSEALLRRRVKTYDRETGEVTGEVTMRQVIGGLAEVTKLEIEVIDGKRPKHFTCDTCGKAFDMPKTWIPTRCNLCRTGGQTECPCGCGRAPPRTAYAPSVTAKRDGPWTCRPERARRVAAARTPEQRSEVARKGMAARTPEQRSEAARKAKASMTPERRSEVARLAALARTPEQVATTTRALRDTRASMTPSQRGEAVRKGRAAMTAEQRSEVARKAWGARRAKAAAVLPSPDGGAQKTGAGD